MTHPDPGPCCHRCGAAYDLADTAARLTWSYERPAEGEPRMLCSACVRAHARDIEARLPERWW